MSLTKASYSMISGAPINVIDYGAKGDGTTNDTVAFQNACAAINATGGGKLIIPAGTYIVGLQNFAGATGKGYSYQAQDIIAITNCANPVIVEGNGAILKIATGLKYGSFNPVTGASYATTPPFTNADYAASVGVVINLSGNTNVAIKDLEIDGNVSGLSLGGQWGDTGYQLNAIGVGCNLNKQVTLENIYTHHNGEDGVYIDWNTGITSSTTQLYPHVLINVKSQYNGRQGMSWVGGNSLTAIGCDFSFTGKNGYVSSSPAAGLDIEPDTGLCINGSFINCRFYDNTGVGALTANSNVNNISYLDCNFIGTTQYSIWPNSQKHKFTNCNIVGAAINVYGNANLTLTTQFFGCTFSMTAANSPSGTIYGSYMDFSAGGSNVFFDGCQFDADATHSLPYSGQAIYASCQFKSLNTGDTFQTNGYFTGYCTLTYSGTWGAAGTAINYGILLNNGTAFGQTLSTVSTYYLGSNDGGSGKTVRSVSWYSPTAWGTSVGGAIRGDIVYDPNPSSGGYVGSVCVTSGTPGTWKTFGLIS